MVKYKLSHWTDKSSFDTISKTRRLLGLTEGRVYLSLGDRPSNSILSKNHRIILEDFEHASKHPLCCPPSLWSLSKLNQWVTPRSSNIIWDDADAELLDAQTLIVKNAKLEQQVRLEKAFGSARYWGRWIVLDCVPVLIILLVFASYFTQNQKYLFIASMVSIGLVIMLFTWYFAQNPINRFLIKKRLISNS